MKRLCTFVATALSAAFASAIPVRWNVDVTAVQPVNHEAYHGETLDLAATMLRNGKPFDLTGESAKLYWQTNGMGDVYWEAPAGVTTNILTATFTPEMDPGATAIQGFIGIAGKNYRASFQLRLRPSPGAVPRTLPLPTRVLDFASVEVRNAPYYTMRETDERILELAPSADLSPATNYTDAVAETLRGEISAHAPGNYAAVSNRAMNALQSETDPTIPAWAKAETKPAYAWGEILDRPSVFPAHRSSESWYDRWYLGGDNSWDWYIDLYDYGTPEMHLNYGSIYLDYAYVNMNGGSLYLDGSFYLNGAYLSAGSSGTIATLGDIDEHIPTSVSSFQNDAGYLQPPATNELRRQLHDEIAEATFSLATNRFPFEDVRVESGFTIREHINLYQGGTFSDPETSPYIQFWGPGSTGMWYGSLQADPDVGFRFNYRMNGADHFAYIPINTGRIMGERAVEYSIALATNRCVQKSQTIAGHPLTGQNTDLGCLVFADGTVYDASTNVTISPAKVGAADAETVAGWEDYWTGEDVRVDVAAGADGLPELSVTEKQQNSTYRTIWRETDRLLKLPLEKVVINGVIYNVGVAPVDGRLVLTLEPED